MEASKRIAFIALVNVLVVLTGPLATAAEPYDRCDMKLDLEKGEKPGPFMGFPYSMIMWALAEKVCGATHRPMLSFVAKMVEAEGCGPNTEISKELQQSAIQMETLSLAQILEITDPAVTQEAVKKEAKNAVEQFGGCESILIGRKKIETEFAN